VVEYLQTAMSFGAVFCPVIGVKTGHAWLQGNFYLLASFKSEDL